MGCRRIAVVGVLTLTACRGVIDDDPSIGVGPQGANVPRAANVKGTAANPQVGPTVGGGGASMPPAAPSGSINPGRVTLRRLNQVEYDRTVRDLIGLDLTPSTTHGFTPDEYGEGFDNNADVLTLAPVDGELYLKATRDIAARALDPANPAARSRILVCDPAKATEAVCSLQIIRAFATRAFRRPVIDEELRPYLDLFAQVRSAQESYDRGIRLAIQGILMAPDFLFRVEIDPGPGIVHPISDFELASRLSYFLWSSMPDESLFAKATEKVLNRPAEIIGQVRRMLANPKADTLNANLVRQWMQTSELDPEKKTPDPVLFPKFDEPLRAAMQQETNLFFGDVMRGKVAAFELLTANHVYVNRRLAQHYGLANAASVSPTQFSRVEISDGRRGGILRAASFLTVTSKNDVQSPVLRGKWVLDRILCSSPPAAPPNVPAFNPNDRSTTEGQMTGTVRQKLEKIHHNRGPICSGCHVAMDAIGFAFEHYDATGAWRDTEGNLPIDSSGVLADTDTKFRGAADLAGILQKDPRFAACIVRKMFSYALGRGLRDSDNPILKDVGARFVSDGMRFPQLIEAVATSPLVTMRQGED